MRVAARLAIVALSVLTVGALRAQDPSPSPSPDFDATAREAAQAVQNKAAATAAAVAAPKPSLAQAKQPIDNFAEVENDIYRGAYLKNAAAYAYLKALGITEVVDLRPAKDDASLCSQYGLDCRQFPIPLLWRDSDFNYGELEQAFVFVLQQQAASRKVYFHCKAGSDRTGALAAALQIRGAACGTPSYDKDQLWSQVNQTLEQHHFHAIYDNLHARIKDWVYNLPKYPWICK